MLHCYYLNQSFIVRTTSGVTEYKTLKVPPLRVQPLHELEGVHGMSQEAFGILCGSDCQGIQFFSPPITKLATRRKVC